MSSVPPSAARSILSIFALFGALGAGIAFAGTDVGSVNFTLGGKRLTSDWHLGVRSAVAPSDTVAPTASQPAMGFELTWGRQGWPALVALDVLHSYDDGLQRYAAVNLGPLVIPPADVRRRASILEIGLGVRRAVRLKGLFPYLGAGGSWVRATVIEEMSDPSQGPFGVAGPSNHGQNTAFGYWVGGGLYRRLGPRLQLGLSVRYSKATLTIPGMKVVGESGHYRFVPGAGTEVEAGGTHIGVIAGWSFPARK